MRLPTAVAVMVASASSAWSDVTLRVDRMVDKVQGWTIGINEGLSGCVAAATYQDDTTVWFGFRDSSEGAYIAFSNPRWKSIDGGARYAIDVQAQGIRNWNGSFVGVVRASERGVYSEGLKREFVIDLMRAGGITLLFEGKQMARLSLRGSASAIASTLDCHKAFQSARGPVATPTRPAPPSQKENTGSSGTGFFVSARGDVLTNNHVVDGCRDVKVSTAGQPATDGAIVATDAKNDLALVRTSMKPEVVPPFSPRARIGEAVFVFGYPLPGLLATNGNFTVGNITATAGLSDDTRMLQISAPVQPGNSGGPLVDQYGNVLGVIVAKLNAMAVAKVTDDVPQNVNFAIKSSVAVSFLDANGVDADFTTSKTAMEPALVAEQSKRFTVKISCR